MIKIFSSEITNFNNNGLGILRDSITCTAREELNGLFELTLECPLHGFNNEYLVEENIIMAPTPRGEQPFRIYSTETNLGTILVNARHIFYDLSNNFLEDVRPTNQNGPGSLAWILANTQFNHPFTSSSNITKTNSATYIRKNVVEALLSDDENSFLNRWGGELIRDKWNITINQQAGADRGVKITYGKNLLGLNASVDISNVITRIMPTGLYENDTVLSLPEKYVDSPYIGYYTSPRIAHYHYSDIKISEELTEAQALQMLREQASLLFTEQKVDEPILNINVDFIELSKTEEYKDYSILETIYPFDIVTVEYAEIGFFQKAKMISYEYDCLLEKYNNIELGQFQSNYADSQAKVGQLLQKVSEEIVNNKSDLQKAIDNATELLTNALGGYVLKRPGELLIMDTDNPNTATKVWRYNLNGLGYSSHGIGGPYETAITMDGSIVANFINTGTLNANLIKAGVLQDKQGKNYINMDTGTFSLGGGKITYDGSKLDINAEAVRLAMGEIGGGNLLKNGDFLFGLTHWVNYNMPSYYIGGLYGNDRALILSPSGSNQNFYQKVTDLIIGQKYVASCIVSAYQQGVIPAMWVGDGQKNIPKKAYNAYHTWVKIEIPFVAVTNEAHINLGYWDEGLTGTMMGFSKVALELGETSSSWSPHYSELQGTNYTFDGESFKIGNDTNVAEHTPTHSIWRHGDGSYTKAGIDGFERWISASSNKYHSLIHTGKGLYSVGPSEVARPVINLPSEFRGTDFRVIVSMEVVSALDFASIRNLRATVINDSSDYVDRINGTITPAISGYSIRYSDGVQTGVTINFSYLVIA